MRRRKTMILFISITIAMLGYGIPLPILPFYLEALGGGGLHLGLLVATYGVMQLIFAPIWGRLSDRYGRKPLLLLGMMGLATSMFLFGYATKLWLLYGAQMVLGTLTSAMSPVSMAYIADISDKDNRGGAIGKIGAAVGLGMILGPGIGGILAANRLSTPFFVAGAVSSLTFVIILLGLPESLPKEKRGTSVDKIKILQLKELRQAMASPIAFGLFTAFVVNFGKSNFSSIYGLYTLEKFGYGPREVGTILMFISFIYLIAQGVLVGPLTKQFGEEKVIRIALVGNAFGFGFMLLAYNYITMAISICFFMLVNALLKPSALAYVSKHSDMGGGVTMGIAEAYMSLGRILGPLWGGVLFDININYPYISGGLFFLLMFLVSMSGRFPLRTSSINLEN